MPERFDRDQFAGVGDIALATEIRDREQELRQWVNDHFGHGSDGAHQAITNHVAGAKDRLLAAFVQHRPTTATQAQVGNLLTIPRQVLEDAVLLACPEAAAAWHAALDVQDPTMANPWGMPTADYEAKRDRLREDIEARKTELELREADEVMARAEARAGRWWKRGKHDN